MPLIDTSFPYSGPCAGGPVDGKIVSASVKRMLVPVKNGPDRGEGDRGFGYAEYVWNDPAQMWIYQVAAHDF